MMNKNYCTSGYLNFSRVGQDYEVFHVLKGRSFMIDQRSFALLKSLKSPATIQAIHKKWQAKFSKKDLGELLRKLTEAELIITDPSAEVIPIIQTPGIFGLDGYTGDANASVVFLGAPYGDGNGTDKNCRLFPGAIRSYLQSQKLRIRKPKSTLNFHAIDDVLDYSKLSERILENRIQDWGDLYIARMEERKETFDNLYSAVKRLMHNGAIPFLLGGDHSISFPAIKAVNDSVGKFIVVQFDAHRDMYGQESLRRQADDIPHHGNFITHALRLKNLEHVYQVGIRGLTSLNDQTNPRITTIWASDVSKQDFLFKDQHAGLPVYITLDIDCIDPAIAPATGTPVPGQITPRDIRRVLLQIQKTRKVAGIDLVEVNPARDVDNRTMQVSAELILSLLAL